MQVVYSVLDAEIDALASRAELQITRPVGEHKPSVFVRIVCRRKDLLRLTSTAYDAFQAISHPYIVPPPYQHHGRQHALFSFNPPFNMMDSAPSLSK